MGKAIGIDFGTTNTVVTYMHGINFKHLRLGSSVLIPTQLHFLSRDEYEFGAKAKSMNITNGSAGLRGFKTRLGDRSASDEVTPSKGDKSFRIVPKVATKFFLNKVAQAIGNQLIKEFGAAEGVLDKMVVTVPAKFNQVEREAIRKAAMEAIGATDKNAVKLVLEPTAAAIAAMYEDGDEAETVAVYDFGGGTFDVSLIKKERGVFRQIDSDGDKNLGGNTLTQKLMARLLEKANDDFGTELPLDPDEFDEDIHNMSMNKYKESMNNLWNSANRGKEELSEEDEIESDVNFYIEENENEYFNWNLDRADLEDLLQDEIKRSVDITCKLIDKYKDELQIDKLVLAGGSSRIPMIRKMLQERLPDLPISANENVSTLISRGAAILAQRMDEITDLTSQKTTTKIGVSASEGVQFNKFQPIIAENQPLPVEGSKEFSLVRDGQESLKISYYEYDVNKNPDAIYISDDGIQEVDTLTISLPPNLNRDATRVIVSFKIDKDGTQTISAQVKDLDDRLLCDGNLEITMASDLG